MASYKCHFEVQQDDEDACAVLRYSAAYPLLALLKGSCGSNSLNNSSCRFIHSLDGIVQGSISPVLASIPIGDINRRESSNSTITLLLPQINPARAVLSMPSAPIKQIFESAVPHHPPRNRRSCSSVCEGSITVENTTFVV